MTIDILSDIHIDSYFNHNNTLEKDAVDSIFKPIFTNNSTRKPADILVIAGDLGHYNIQNIQMLEIFRTHYSNIIIVLGNHDYYLINDTQVDNYKTSFNRVNEFKQMLKKLDNVFCLDGNVVTINNIKFGGAMAWYDDAYAKKYFPDIDIKQLWKEVSNDNKMIYGINQMDQLYKEEYNKLEKVYKDVDVMVTHINPSFLHEHINTAYENQESNSFYTFDGHKLLKNGNMKYWIFGHTHDNIEYELENKKVICNAMGTPTESEFGDWVWIKTIEI
jgi:metallophosphoesterase superfamily enzyme